MFPFIADSYMRLPCCSECDREPIHGIMCPWKWHASKGVCSGPEVVSPVQVERGIEQV